MRKDIVSQIQKFGTGSSSFAIHDAGAISPEWYRGAHTPDRQTERAPLILFPSCLTHSMRSSQKNFKLFSDHNYWHLRNHQQAFTIGESEYAKHISPLCPLSSSSNLAMSHITPHNVRNIESQIRPRRSGNQDPGMRARSPRLHLAYTICEQWYDSIGFVSPRAECSLCCITYRS